MKKKIWGSVKETDCNCVLLHYLVLFTCCSCNITYLGSLFVDVHYLLEFTMVTTGSNIKNIQFTNDQGTRFALKVISGTNIVFEVRLSKLEDKQ